MKESAEIIITSDSFPSAKKLIDFLGLETDHKMDVEAKFSLLRLNYDGEHYNLKEVDFFSESYDVNSLLGMLKKTHDLGGANTRLKRRIKELEKQIEELQSLPTRNLSINKKLTKKILKLRKEGLSYQSIADQLHDEGFKNSEGRRINPKLVARLYNRGTEEQENKKLNKAIQYTTDTKRYVTNKKA